MPVILDTDLLTVLQSGSQPACSILKQRLDQVSDADIYTTIITLQEQLRGWLAVLNRARTEKRLLSAYAELHAMLHDFAACKSCPLKKTPSASSLNCNADVFASARWICA
jgi:hypothetical protein